MRALIEKALAPSPWDLGNDVLYDLCRSHPTHCEESVVIAKIWLIGRSYAAAIERRLEKTEENDDFYVNSVASAIIKSDIDAWLLDSSQYMTPSIESLPSILDVHWQVTSLFSRISGLEKRSLASKYLHFHQPNLFYIYDTRAVEAIRKLSSIVGRADRAMTPSDNEYRKFSEKCLRLQRHIEAHFGVLLKPREIDKLLLEVYAQDTQRLT